MTLSKGRFRLAYTLPSIHFGLWLIAFLGSQPRGWQPLGSLGVVLAVVDFPVSIIAIALAWVLPETVEIVGFGIMGTFWWYLLGRKADVWIASRHKLEPTK